MLKRSRMAVVAVALLTLALAASEASANEVAIKAACTADKSPTIKEIKDRGYLRWALGIAGVFGAKDASGEYIGTEADNAREFASFLGVPVEIRNYSYDLLPPTVATGNADIVGASLYITDKRKEVVDFSKPYQKEGQVFVVLGSRDDINSIENLNEASIKVVNNTGSGQVDLSRKLLPNAVHITADLSSNAVAINFLASGQADATMNDASAMPAFRAAAKNIGLKVIGRSGVIDEELPPGDKTIAPFDVGFAIAKGDPGFLSCVNAYVDYLNEDNRFHDRYLGWIKKMTKMPSQ